MSLIQNTLFLRIVSAAIGILIFYFSYYFFQTDGLLTLIYFTVGYGSHEFLRMFFRQSSKGIRILLWIEWMLLFSIGASGVIEERSSLFFQVFTFAIIFQITVFLIIHKTINDIQLVFRNITLSLLGLIYLVLFPVCVAWVLSSYNGITWFLALLLIVFSCDIGAYFAGVSFGKHHLAPLLSPKKTKEGAVGGLLLSTLVAISFSYALPNISIFSLIFIGFLSTVLAIAGDFFESLMKRVSDVKDTGGFMPGHGGVLDRIDSILFAAPFYLVLSQLFTF